MASRGKETRSGKAFTFKAAYETALNNHRADQVAVDQPVRVDYSNEIVLSSTSRLQKSSPGHVFTDQFLCVDYGLREMLCA